jgi:hypothetical protein
MQYKVDFPIMQLDRIVLCVEAENKDDAIDRAQEVLMRWESAIRAHDRKIGDNLIVERGEIDRTLKRAYGGSPKDMHGEIICARLVKFEPNADGWLGSDIEVEAISTADAA